jgi:6-phosphogluconolactonase
MINRRTFMSWVAASAAMPEFAPARTSSNGVALYASVGAELTQYDVDVDGAALAKRGVVTLPANVQYAWPHASRRYLYVASSNSAPGSGPAGNAHHASSFRIDPASGALTPHGQPISLPSRPIHMSTDIPSEHALIAYNNPSNLTVHRIKPDGTLGEAVKQSGELDTGIYAHQIRVTPNNRMAMLVTRGNDAAGGTPEDPGALKIFSYKDGMLTREVSVAPDGGYGFGPRHLDFHPMQPWVYVSLERQNKLYVYKMSGDTLNPTAMFKKDTLGEPGNVRSRQAAGTVHVHPNGRFVYGVNRADTTAGLEGRRVFIGGENTLAVYAITPTTGEPTPIQHVDTRGIHCRTFHIDPSGRILVAAHIMPLAVRDGPTVRTVPACLSVFRIGRDGKLDFVRKYDIDVGNKTMFWMGMVQL